MDHFDIIVEESLTLYFQIYDEDLLDLHFLWLEMYVNGVVQNLPSFIDVDQNLKRIRFQPISQHQAGTYNFKLAVEDTDSVGEGIVRMHEDYFTVEVIYIDSNNLGGGQSGGSTLSPAEQALIDLSDKFQAEITQVTDQGLVIITFEEELYGIADTSLINQSNLKVELLTNYEKLKGQLKEWKFVRIKPRQLHIQLIFKNPMKVSAY